MSSWEDHSHLEQISAKTFHVFRRWGREPAPHPGGAVAVGKPGQPRVLLKR